MHPFDYPNLGSPGNFPRPCADLLLERYRHQQHKASIKTTNTNAAMPAYMRSLRTMVAWLGGGGVFVETVGGEATVGGGGAGVACIKVL